MCQELVQSWAVFRHEEFRIRAGNRRAWGWTRSCASGSELGEGPSGSGRNRLGNRPLCRDPRRHQETLRALSAYREWLCNRSAPTIVPIWPSSHAAHVPPISGSYDRERGQPIFSPALTDLGRSWPDFDRARPTLANIGQRACPRLPTFRQRNSPSAGQLCCPMFGRCCLEFHHFRPSWAKWGKSWRVGWHVSGTWASGGTWETRERLSGARSKRLYGYRCRHGHRHRYRPVAIWAQAMFGCRAQVSRTKLFGGSVGANGGDVSRGDTWLALQLVATEIGCGLGGLQQASRILGAV